MVNTFYADPAVGGDGSTTTDDNSATTGLGNDGFRTRLVKMFSNIVAIANFVANKASTVLNSPATNADSTTSLTIGTGSKTFTLTVAGKSIYVGQRVVCASKANPNNQMLGVVTSAPGAGSSLTVNVDQIGGSGTFADWTISLTATSGVAASRQVATGGIASGGGDLSADRTITVTKATVGDIQGAFDGSHAWTSDNAYGAAAPVSVAYAATLTLNLASGSYIDVGALTGNMVLANPSGGMTPGRSGRIRVPQGSAGGWTISYGAYWTPLSGTPEQLPTTANKVMWIFYYVRSATEIEYSVARNG